MKNVLILYGSYGGGHISAAKSIFQHIKENYKDINIEMFDCIEYINKILNKLTTKAYSEMAKNAPWAWGKVYFSADKGALRRISNTSNKIMAHKLNKLFLQFKPDLIISTHPFSSNMCSYLKKKSKLKAKVATVMTDYAVHNQWSENADYIDYFFVAHDGMKNDLIEKHIPHFKIFVTGIPVSERFSEKFDKKEICNSFYLDSNKPIALFFAGGQFGLGKSKTFEVFDTLLKIITDLQVVAVAGRNPKMQKLFQDTVLEHKKEKLVKVLSFTDKVPELMSISDFVITKPGGLTTTESLVSALPILVINPLPGQEEENAQFIENHEVGTWLKFDDNMEAHLKAFIKDSKKHEVMRENEVELARPNSTRDICNILLNI